MPDTKRLEKSQGREKQELFEDLVRMLAVHEAAEEEVVHPRARVEIGSGNRVVDARLQEENEAKHALAELYDLGVDHPEFDGSSKHWRHRWWSTPPMRSRTSSGT